MSRYIMICRLRFPAILLLVGVLALLHQMDIIGNFWHLFWPLLLIMLGLLMLAERAALAAEGGYAQGPCQSQPYPGQYPGQYTGQYPAGAPYAGTTAPPAGTGVPPSTAQPSNFVSLNLHDSENKPEGGQS